jgi:hypothetical protein
VWTCTLITAGMIACLTARASAEELTIFWAEWDPANYLQELANQYTAETGVKVTVETAPLALAAPTIRWGPEASSNVLRTRLRCTRCGARYTSLRHPGHVNAIVGTAPFPVRRP